ncbi:faciogenital dysplasia protein [Anaeramoeba flamelloides]|uniref:Faciogenital dysplasia protein n=1 Tax=Anaeramoeba flamelloides TaxID=1746091 RepID=A0ABQ8Z423_9EUKA|nr:faciogenital dysplasia protein [Anaeramoeba flamelloides]
MSNNEKNINFKKFNANRFTVYKPISPIPLPSTKVTFELQTKRDRAVYEVLTTEETYVFNLNRVNQMKLLLEKETCKKSTFITMEQVKTLFKNHDQLLQLNLTFLETLKERLQNFNEETLLGDLFLKWFPFFRIYIDYVISYEGSMKTILDSLSTNKDFNNWEQEVQVEFKLNLQSFLIQPIQRIPRYQLLVNEILKHTDPEHKDYSDLQQSLEMIKKVATDVNTAIIDAKQTIILVDLNKKLSNVDLIKPHRKYVCEGVLMKKSKKKDHARLFYLFSDLLIIASKDISNYTVHNTIQLEDLNVEEIEDTKTLKNAFTIQTPAKSFIVYASQPQEKQLWFVAIKETLQEYIKQKESSPNKTIGGEIKQLAPVNIQDKDALECNICHQPFTMMRRRHHCRKCGACICGECSKHKTVLKGRQIEGEVRVCNNCFIEIKDEEEQEQLQNIQKKNKSKNKNRLKKKSSKSHNSLRRKKSNRKIKSTNKKGLLKKTSSNVSFNSRKFKK